MKRKVYVETSVISYLTTRPSKTILGAAHQQITTAWWERRSEYELLISESVLRECGAGDPEAAQRRLAMVADLALLLLPKTRYGSQRLFWRKESSHSKQRKMPCILLSLPFMAWIIC
jgi:hypothetical protein